MWYNIVKYKKRINKIYVIIKGFISSFEKDEAMCEYEIIFLMSLF